MFLSINDSHRLSLAVLVLNWLVKLLRTVVNLDISQNAVRARFNIVILKNISQPPLNYLLIYYFRSRLHMKTLVDSTTDSGKVRFH